MGRGRRPGLPLPPHHPPPRGHRRPGSRRGLAHRRPRLRNGAGSAPDGRHERSAGSAGDCHRSDRRLRMAVRPPSSGYAGGTPVSPVRVNRLPNAAPALVRCGWARTSMRHFEETDGVRRMTANEFAWIDELIDSAADSLDLRRHGLATLPAKLFTLRHLRELYLQDNALSELPPEIGELTGLRVLYLQGNHLTALPPEIGRLKHLRRLYLQGNRVRELPAEIGELRELETLLVQRNELTSLPAEIGALESLRALDVQSNRLTGLPAQIGQLENLRDLQVQQNRLDELPPTLGLRTQLERFDASDNRLTSLPAELANALSPGTYLRLEGNPLREPIPELLVRGVEALCVYLRSIRDGVAHYEAKVLLIGEGNVGKTSLVAALLDEPFVAERPTTHGIEVRPLMLRHPADDAIVSVRTWDFGGQEVYRITHQFFFSRRALYLVVWHAREGTEQNDVEGWLSRIRLRVGAAVPAMIVATHGDERYPDLDYPTLRRKYSGMLTGPGQHIVDSRSGSGIDALRDAMAATVARLPHIGQILSVRWIAARDEILARAASEPQMAFEDFRAVCEANGLADDEVETLAELMHDLGQVIYYGDDDGLRDIVVLNPEWLTKAIGYVLEDRATIHARGILDRGRLREIWRDRSDGPNYPQRHHRYFLRLMEKFDVCYRIDDERYSLVAQLVPHERPPLPWEADSPLPAGVRRLGLVCRMSEPAPGLVPWLTVRHHRASTNRHWRRGVFLRHPTPAYASDALVELVAERELRIEVRAPSPDLMFNVLRDSLDDVLSRWPGLQYEMQVPCPTVTADVPACPGYFGLDGLIRLREAGHEHHACMRCARSYEIARLLTGFGSGAGRLQPTIDLLQDQIVVIRKGVDRLELYAAQSANAMRRVLMATTAEVDDCPRLFTIEDRPVGRVRRLTRRPDLSVTLWCEHPDAWHPVAEAEYGVARSRDWLLKIGPYAALVVKSLQLVVPILGAAVGVVLSEDELKKVKQHIELTKTLVSALPDFDQEDVIYPQQEAPGRLTAAEGASLRIFRSFLFQADASRSFGGMRRVAAPSGEFLWVCPHHYHQYDPGLPAIPAGA
ncbi:COR domain-containing protein [Dactylosporangium sp. NPDC051541]|uniref:COR domain-containing protein n=1 Tax=Dactylosporangium sp. NPDC051541 TaxID=3363977 RepID=UPI00379F0402